MPAKRVTERATWTETLWCRPRVNRLRLRASATRTARPPCGESLLELTFQTLGRDVMFGLNLHRDLDPDPRGLEADDLNVVGHVLPVRMVIVLAFFKRIFKNLHAVAPDESG